MSRAEAGQGMISSNERRGGRTLIILRASNSSFLSLSLLYISTSPRSRVV